MKKFLRNLFLFLAPLCIVIFGLTGYAVKKYNIRYTELPAPNLSASYSYNKKIEFIKNRKADIMTIGSSMSLNNVYSESVIKHFNNNAYLNVSSWGLTIRDIYFLLKFQSGYLGAKTVIISSNIIDFAERETAAKSIDYKSVENYLSASAFLTDLYYRSYTPSYLIEKFEYGKKVVHNIHDYDCLNYDAYGAVMMDSAGFNIDSNRWNEHKFPHADQISYNYLDSIGSFCQNKGIRLIFVHTPYRSAITMLPTFETNRMNEHIRNVEKIANRHEFTFINSTVQLWEDNLFVDASHFNSSGAQKFTDFFLTHLKYNTSN